MLSVRPPGICTLLRNNEYSRPTFNFAEAAQLARNAGAMLPVSDALEAMQTAHRLLQNGALREKMSIAAFKLVDENRGATEKTVALIAPILGAS